MKKRHLALIIFLLLILGVAVAVLALRAPDPPGRDYVAEYAALAEGESAWSAEKQVAFDAFIAAAERIETIEADAGAALNPVGGGSVRLDVLESTSAALEHETEQDALWRAASEDALRAYVDQRIFEDLARLRETPGARAPVSSDGGSLFNRLLPWLPQSRKAASYEAARMTLAMRRGDRETALEALENQLALSRLAWRDPTLIGMLVGIALEVQALGEVKRAVAEGGIDAETASAILEAIDGHAAALPEIAYSLEAERIGLLDTIARAYDGRLETTDFGVDLPNRLLLSLLASHGATYEQANELMDLMVAYAQTPPRERGGLERTPSAHLDALSRRFVLLGILFPAVEKVVDNADRAVVQRDGARVMLALERRRAEKGGYPESLDALVPQYMDALPVDALAADGRLRYRLLEPGHELPVGTPYLLYSVGEDGVDDGGDRSADVIINLSERD